MVAVHDVLKVAISLSVHGLQYETVGFSGCVLVRRQEC